jgi:tRNA G18 (ribose-2'-O)-methylase SpoU
VLADLKKEGYMIVAIEQTSESQSLESFSPAKGKKYCLVFGNEVHGISEESIALADLALEIPQAGTKHSLNVSVCLGIVVWELFRKLSL